MTRLKVGRLLLCLAFSTCCPATATATTNANDNDNDNAVKSILVFGSSGGAFTSALAAARTGGPNVNVTWLALASGGGAGGYVGGMVSGGLQHADCGNSRTIGGYTREYFSLVEMQYPNRSTSPNLQPCYGPPCWLYEAHVGEAVMRNMSRNAGVTIVNDGVGLAEVSVTEGRVTTVKTLDGRTFSADLFIDGSYEGDLLKLGGATMVTGRESAAQYNESYGGRQPIINYFQLQGHLDPYWPNTTTPIPLVSGRYPGLVGEADNGVMAYSYRLCMTRSPSHSIPITSPPPGYNSTAMEAFRRYAKMGHINSMGSVLACLGPVPNNYTDCPPDDSDSRVLSCKCDMIGSGGLNTDMTGESWMYPDASIKDRQAIALKHKLYAWSILWFLLTDPSVPAAAREETKSYGLCSDEWPETGGWPSQLYVRTARRLVGDYVFTQNIDPVAAEQGIGLGSYTFDVHNVWREIHHDADGSSWAVDEGGITTTLKQPPFSIPYGTLLPKRSELTNVLAPVPASASHVRMASLRLEPTWMIMGHGAGTAAALAVANPGMAVQDVNVTQLQAVLESQQQRLDPNNLPPPQPGMV